MTPEKTDELAVFGYRPPSAGMRMWAGDEDEPDDELITDEDEPTYSEARTLKVTLGRLKRIIREALASEGP